MKNRSIFSVIKAAILSGILAYVIVFICFCFIPSGWFLFIIPAVLRWGVKKFSKISKEEILDDESYQKLSKRTGLACAGIVLWFIALIVLPGLFLLSWEQLAFNIIFYIICGICVFSGYRSGVNVITDAYYDAYSEDDETSDNKTNDSVE